MCNGSYAASDKPASEAVGLSNIYFLQIIFWNTDTWEKRKSVTIQLPAGKAPVGDTRVQFHSDQIHLLVCHETQLALYDAAKMECLTQVRNLIFSQVN